MENRKSEPEIFGENLRFLRKVHRLSQKEMAKIMGVSVYCLQRAEHGIFANSLDADVLVNLARHFHLRASALFTPSEEWNIPLL